MRYKLFYVIISILFLSNRPLTLASNYYVSPFGNDDNLGSNDKPLKTITKGISYLKAGDILYVHTGVFKERIFIETSGTISSPIIISAFPGEFPVIDGNGQLPNGDWDYLMELVGNYIEVSGFEIRNSNTSGIHLGGGGVILFGAHNKVSNLNVHHCWSSGIIAQGDYSIVEDCQVWQCALSNSENPGSVNWGTGLSAARSSEDGITTNAILRHNIIFNNWGEGLSSFESEGTIIEDNVVFDNWSINLYISDTRGALVQRNMVYNTENSIGEYRSTFTLADEIASVPRSADNIIINNLILNTNFHAFWWTLVPGSGLENVLIANNTIINGQIVVGANPADEVVNKSAIICNNIFSNEKSDSWIIEGSLANLEFSNNLWSSLPPNGLSGSGDVIGDPKIQKLSNTGPNELTSNYFKLLESSPAINMGKFLSGVLQDFVGTYRDDNPDIGAFEFTSELSFLNAYPNPNNGKFFIFGENWNNLKIVIEIFNMDGSKIYSNTETLDKLLYIDLSYQPSGIYIIRAISDNRVYTRKVILNKEEPSF
jgi:parallel beta-helix repeat protein